MSYKNLIIMGPPGAGKGTQSEKIVAALNIPHISTGDMFRRAISEKTPTGILAKSFIDKGELVPDSVTNQLVRERLQEADCQNGFLLDGYPRTLVQAEELTKILNDLNIKLDAVVDVKVDDSYLIERITGRRTCTECGESYHIVAKKPKTEGICDKCGSKLIQRADDEEETIKNRLAVYYAKTEPVLSYYEKQSLVKGVNGMGGINEIFENVKKVLGDL